MRTVVAGLLALGMSGVAFAADDADRCGVQTLRGRYVFSASGFMVNPASGVVQPKAIVEFIDFNGDGTLAVPAATGSVNGTVTRSLPSAGTYTVAEDCLGTIAFDGPAFDIFISPRGNQLWLIQTNPNNVFEGSAMRTSREPPTGIHENSDARRRNGVASIGASPMLDTSRDGWPSTSHLVR